MVDRTWEMKVRKGSRISPRFLSGIHNCMDGIPFTEMNQQLALCQGCSIQLCELCTAWGIWLSWVGRC